MVLFGTSECLKIMMRAIWKISQYSKGNKAPLLAFEAIKESESDFCLFVFSNMSHYSKFSSSCGGLSGDTMKLKDLKHQCETRN